MKKYIAISIICAIFLIGSTWTVSQIVTWSSISGKPSFLEVGTYTGNGISKLVSTTGTGTPCFVLAQGLAGTGRPPYYKTTAMGSTNSLRIDNSSNFSITNITALGSGSFTVGSDAATNNSGETYYYIAAWCN